VSTFQACADHLVIGGGPAGSMLALRLASAGRRVTVVEREPAAHDKVCGEFLSREALHYLELAGIDPLALGAQVIDTVRLSSGNKIASAPLPFQALSLSRRILDQALLARAAENCQIVRGVSVESLTADSNIWTAHLSSGKSLPATYVFVATGKHDLRGFARPAGRQSDLIGFKMHWRLAPAQIAALRQTMDLYLFRSGYGGLSLIEDDVANLCFVVRRGVLRALGAWPALLDAILEGNRHLRQLLLGAEPLWPRPLAISPVPYGLLAAAPRGPWCVGDQAAVIPSFTGDGISIALHSGVLAAEMFLAGQSAADFHRTLHAQLRRSIHLATALSRAAVTAPGRIAALPAVALFPRAMQAIARSTRIPERAMLGRTRSHIFPRTPPGDLSATPQPE
jgi:menaquinone-9 beta-reductase